MPPPASSATPPEYRGVTMAMHSTVGFGLSGAGAWGIATAAAPAVLLALLFVYAIAIPADSGALTSGMTLSAKAATPSRTATIPATPMNKTIARCRPKRITGR